MASPESYLCDTLPQAKLAQATASPPFLPSHDPAHASVAFQSEQPLVNQMDPPEVVHPTPAPPQRKLCPRHKRMADEGTNLKLQQVREGQIANVYIMLTHVPGFGRPPLAGAGVRQHRLGELLGLAASPPCLDSPGSADHVLLLPALSPR